MDNATRANHTAHVCVNKLHPTHLMVICAVLAVLTLVTFFGNLLVIISIAYFHQLRTLTNYLVLSLAVSDLLVGVAILPFVMFLFVSPCSELLCTVKSFFDTVLCLASIFNLYCICVERYFAVCQPLSYRRKINSRVISGMIVLSWSAAVALALVTTLGGKRKEVRCAITSQAKLSFVAAVFAFHVPVAVMATLYTRILRVVRKQARSIQMAGSSEGTSKAERKSTLMLALVVCVFLVCWAPFSICCTFLPFRPVPLPLSALEAFKFFGWLNSLLNPLIYAYSHSWYRSAFRLMLTGQIFAGKCANARL